MIELNNKGELLWYAIRVTYSREMLFKTYLDEKNIENFIPMHYEIILRGDQKKRKLVPVIHNLVFVHTTPRKIAEIKNEIAFKIPVRYIMNRETNAPLIVPEYQMQSFIKVASTYDEQVIYLDSQSVLPGKGDKVRITDGVFAGVEGDFVRIKGDRRVVVSIPGIMSVATAFVPLSMIEKI